MIDQDTYNTYNHIKTSNMINIKQYKNDSSAYNNSYKYINSPYYYNNNSSNNNTSNNITINKQKEFSKVAGDAMSCLKYISIYSFLLTDISFFLSRLLLFFMLQTVSCNVKK